MCLHLHIFILLDPTGSKTIFQNRP